MAKFTDAGGRRVMRSTKQEEKRAAMATALAWENASRKARRRELTQTTSVKILRELLEATTDEELRSPRIADTLNGFLASRKALGRSASTYARYQPIVGGFLAFLGPMRADAAVTSLTPSEVEKWRDAENKSGKSPKTINVGLGVLKAGLNAARRRGEILSNPVEAVEPMPGRGDVREPFTDGEIAALLKSASVDWQSAILLGAWCGLRLSDATSVTWDQVNLPAGVLAVTPDKTDRPLSLALAPELRAHLGKLQAGVGKAPVMPSLAGRKTGSNGAFAGLSNEFSRLMRTAGVAGALGRIKTGKGRRVASKSFHALRHSFVSRCVAGGASDSVTKAMTGHSTESAFKRYVHLSLDSQRAALARLPQFGST